MHSLLRWIVSFKNCIKVKHHGLFPPNVFRIVFLCVLLSCTCISNNKWNSSFSNSQRFSNRKTTLRRNAKFEWTIFQQMLQREENLPCSLAYCFHLCLGGTWMMIHYFSSCFHHFLMEIFLCTHAFLRFFAEIRF